MSPHPSRETLSALVDDRLGPEMTADARAHLAECEECRAFVRRSRRLMADLRSLPSEIEAPRSPERPWLEEEEAGRRSPVDAARRTGRRERSRPRTKRVWLAAAAVLLLAAASAVLIGRTGSDLPASAERPTAGTSAPEAGRPPSPPGALSSRAVEVDPADLRSYATAVAELAAVYRRRKGAFPPDVTGAVDASLASLDEAIRRTSEAAERHPDAPLVRRMLVARYERKLELLRRTLDLEWKG